MKTPKFGSITTTQVDDKGNGATTRVGYFANKPAAKTVWFEESIALEDGKPQLLKEVLNALDLFLEDSNEVDIELRRNQSGKIRLVKRHLVK